MIKIKKTKRKNKVVVNPFNTGGVMASNPNPYLQLGTMAGKTLGRAAESSGSAAGTIGGGALKGAAAGAAAGSVVPGIGTVIGGAVGAVAGTIGGAIKNKKNKEAAAKVEQQRQLQLQQYLTSIPTPSKGVVPGITNPYMLAFGGMATNNINTNVLETYESGGLHEQNPLGGIPLGVGSNGKVNTVEEGESSFNFGDGKYIFSNRLIIE